jgi:hypothetical protein
VEVCSFPGALDFLGRSGQMKEIKPGDQVVGMAMDGETIEVFKVVKVLPDGVQVEESSGKISRASLRMLDEKIYEKIVEKQGQVKTLKQEIRQLYEKLEPIG